MATLPPHPDLDQLRRQAKELLRAARNGDAHALARIGSVSEKLTLSTAQLVLAREHGFASWPAVKTAVDARTRQLAEQVGDFLVASVTDATGRAAHMLRETPELADHGFATAVVLGDTARVHEALERDPGLATRVDDWSGWTPLHAVCSSRWHHLDPARTDGLAVVARLLLDAGADPNAITSTRPEQGARWSALGCATAAASTGSPNDALIRLLVESGAVPVDRDLYLLAFSDRGRESLARLLEQMPDPASSVSAALTTPIGRNDLETLRIMLDGGVDPRRYHNGDDTGSSSPAYDAIIARCSADDPGLVERLTGGERAAILTAAETGNTDAVRVMLDLGFPLDVRGDNGATALHAAAYAGSADAVRLLLDRGADLEATDTSWHATPLGWAIVGSGERPPSNRAADWIATVLALLDAGADTSDVTLSPDDRKPPSDDVARLLREQGIGGR
jgi:hypothetical protein